jgi:hypothetical protein
MEDKYYPYELLKIAFGRYITMVQQDRLLSEFSRGFKGPRDETGLLDAGPPQDYVQAYLKAQGIQQKADGVTNIGGNNFLFDSNGNLTIQSQSGSTQILREDLLNVIAFLMKGPPPEMNVQGVLPGTVAQAAYDFSPQLKERQQRAMEEMERWARASSKAYPKNI